MDKLRESSAQKTQESLFFNQEGRSWLQRQIALIGKGACLLKKVSVRTPTVKLKALHLSSGRSALEAARNMVHWCSTQIKFAETSNMTAINFYCRQTADDIISGRPIPTFRGSKFGLVGCQTFAGTLMALLRAARPASGKITDVVAVRTLSPRIGKGGKLIGMPHTIVTFRVNGELFVADAFKKGYSFFGTSYIGKKGHAILPAKEIEKQIAELKKQGHWKEALDPADHGVATFEAYIEEARAAGDEIVRDLDLDNFMREIKKT